MNEMLRVIDDQMAANRERHIAALLDAKVRGVQIVADHRLQDGSFTILVSPGDHAKLKELTKWQK